MRGSTVAFPDNLKASSPWYYALLTVLDVSISCLIVAPAVVAYWRGVWVLSQSYIFPDDPTLSAVVSTLIGYFGHLFFTFSQHFFAKYFHPDKNRIVYYVVSRLYTACFAVVCVNGWRGPWYLLDLYTEMELTSVTAMTVVSLVALVVLRALRNVSAPPGGIAMDRVQGYFEVMTMFRVTVGEKTSLYILDCLFSVLVIGTLVVFVWRGVWVVFDMLLLPGNEVWSSWSSLVLGYVLVAVAFLLQPAMKWLCDRLQGAARLIAVDVFLLLSLVATVNVWRGIWNLLNIYLLPDMVELGCWITHLICFFMLVLMGCSNSLLVRGVYIDAEEPLGKCVVFPCYYLRVIFQEERTKKMNETLQNVDSCRQDNEGKYTNTSTELNCLSVAVIDVNCKTNNKIGA